MIVVNGRDAQWREGLTIRSLMQEHRYTSPRIVVKVNGQVVRQEQWESHAVQDGDDVLVLHLIAGG
ncbi:MAG: sulfur carrier protein ThiS [Anaerolineales bacterium]|jgi:sulfur carrier protein|nr:sulfur carrier protein ThiS [Anaerolineales bacterium]